MSKYKTIAFATGGVVPADQAKKGREQRPGPHIPVEVLADYADYLIDDRLAYAWSKDTAPPAPADTSADAILVAARAEASRLVDAAKVEKALMLEDAEAEKRRIADGAEEAKVALLSQAERDAGAVRSAAKSEADALIAEAKRKADVVLEEAKVEAAKLKSGGGSST